MVLFAGVFIMSKQAFKRVRRALKMEVSRKPLDAFAWPGGYPMFYVCADSGVLCPKCANAEIDRIAAEMKEAEENARRGRRHRLGQFQLIGAEVNYEDVNLSCDHCNEFIDPAYLR